MRIELKENVHLMPVPTIRYKTVQMLVRFSTPLRENIVTKRALLSNLMETNSKLFPVQTELSKKLAKLYGASFYSYVDRKGNMHRLNFVITIVNDSYVQDKQLLEQAVDFLKEIIFYPNVKEDAFDQETFNLEQDNLVKYIENLVEDKSYYAKLRLQELYYRSSKAQAEAICGTTQATEKLTAKELARYHQKVLAEDKIDIMVMGDINETRVQKLFSDLPFIPRKISNIDLFYNEPLTNVVIERAEQESLNQSKLNLAYHLPIKFTDSSYFALQVFNGLFGGFSQSKLFLNIREKESMTYSIGSSFDSFRSLMMVDTGINRVNRDKVIELIHEQLFSLQSGDFEETAFLQTKAMLRNVYLLSRDNIGILMEEKFINFLLPQTKFSEEEYLQNLQLVTRKEVIEVANKIKLQAIFFLEGTKS
ncbi:MAG: insulinase family protein [Streptococcaceae bacterium]|jgi:predicted Zn-dependent peptidase|nr:insulinase family protein [Streptococcaceae bacterium]